MQAHNSSVQNVASEDMLQGIKEKTATVISDYILLAKESENCIDLQECVLNLFGNKQDWEKELSLYRDSACRLLLVLADPTIGTFIRERMGNRSYECLPKILYALAEFCCSIHGKVKADLVLYRLVHHHTGMGELEIKSYQETYSLKRDVMLLERAHHNKDNP